MFYQRECIRQRESWQLLGALGMFVVLLCGSVVHNCTLYTSRICIKSEMNINNSPHLLGTYLQSAFFGLMTANGEECMLCWPMGQPVCIYAYLWKHHNRLNTTFSRFKLYPQMYTSCKSCPLIILLSKPRQSSRRLRWMTSAGAPMFMLSDIIL